jgi:hypothetical protein
MRLLSWLNGRRSDTEAQQAAQAMRRRYGDQADDLASKFVANAADDGDEKARRHWSAIRAELRRITDRSRDSIEDSRKSKGGKRRTIEWD